MLGSQQREGKDATSDSEGGEAPAKPGGLRQKLGVVAHCAMSCFAPAVAVVALVVAVIAFVNNQSSQERLSKAVATMDSMNTSLTAAKIELERLGFAMAREKNRQEDEQIKQAAQDAREAKIIQSINQLQTKMKISPTLDEMLLQAASAPVAASAVPAAASAVAGTAVMPEAAGSDKKPAARMPALKESIEQLNKK